MSQPESLAWFARHELRLFWRDWISMLTRGKRSREPILAAVFAIFLILIHVLAYIIVARFAETGGEPGKATLATVTISMFLSWTLMLSQAIESVTRAFYARGDLDLILASPASVRRVFAVRVAAIGLATAALTTALVGPFVNALLVIDGPRWLAAYGVLGAMGALAAALAVVVAFVLFRLLGPKRTRLVSQIVSAVVAAAFVIGAQGVAIFSTGSLSRLALFSSDGFLALMPEAGSPVWGPARAAMGDPVALAAVLVVCFGLLALAVAAFSARFGDLVSAASFVAHEGKKRRGRPSRRGGFRRGSTKRALRRKEWALLRRDPWLMSQTLMQILYLLPPALLLWYNFGDSVSGLLVLVPVVVMASGQLAGGLAWLAVSGEDAPDFLASAPVSVRAVTSAKIEAVLGAVAVVVGPLVFALALTAPRFAAVAIVGIAVSAASGTLIQIWFRAQARRTTLRRRQIPSRIATLAEALSSILWAGTAALAAVGTWLASVTALAAILALAGTWAIRPRPAEGT